jgi:hypothetical protein
LRVVGHGGPESFPKGIEVKPNEDGSFRVTMSAGFAQVSCDFTEPELVEVIAGITNVLHNRTETRELSEARREDIDIDEEFDRA